MGLNRRYRIVLCAALASASSGPAAAQAAPQTCAVGIPLPAYSHNDYENPTPLYDALAMGYQGVEADFHLVRGELLVAHDLPDVRPERTLQALYLEPLRDWIGRCGTVLGGERPLLLNIEAKTGGMEAYTALTDVLRDYRDILTVVQDGTERPGPVQVVLVGWHPSLAILASEAERMAAVQWYADDDVPQAPAHLIRLISVDYGDAIGWSGEGRPPQRASMVLGELGRARDAVPGRLSRAHNVPVDSAVYRMLLEAGVNLIGTKDLDGTLGILGNGQ